MITLELVVTLKSQHRILTIMSAYLNYLEKPKLKKSLLIAGLPGIAHIGKLAVEYLMHELHAKRFAELYSEHFPEWVVREDGLVKTLKVDFCYCRPDGTEKDVILATADAQATSSIGHYKLSSEILDVAMRHESDTVVTMAAYMLSPYESRSSVVGTATDAEMAELLHKHGIELLDGGTIVGMNGLLLGLARARGLRGFCLLGATGGGLLDVSATEAVLQVLSKVLSFKLDLTNLHRYAPALPKLKPPKPRLLRASEEEVSYIR